MNPSTSTRNQTASRLMCVPLALACIWSLSNPVKAQTPGLLDPNFNSNGIRISDLSGQNSDDAGRTVLPHSDGYVVAGDAVRSGSTFAQFALAKYLNDGTLSQTLFSDLPSTISVTNAITGVVIGSSTTPTTENWIIAKFDQDLTWSAPVGIPYSNVLSFNSSNPNESCAPLAIAARSGFLNPVTFTPETRYTIAGYSGSKVAVARVRLSGLGGLLDDSFSEDGKILIDIPDMSNEQATGIAIAPDGAIFIAGGGTSTLATGGSTNGFIAKLNNDGLDLTWGSNGIVRYSIEEIGSINPITYVSSSTRIDAITIDNEGRLLVCGQITRVDDVDFGFFVARRMPDGTVDPTFGTQGRVTVQFPESGGYRGDFARALVIQPDGRIVVVGTSQYTGSSGVSNTSVALARLEENGTLDASFGTGGKVQTNVASGNDELFSVIIDGPRIVVAGSSRSQGNSGATSNCIILRYLTGPFVGILELGSLEGTPMIYPNPLAETTTFSYSLLESERLTIALHDLQGRLITTFLNGRTMPAGEHKQTVSMPADLAQGNYLLVFSSPKGKMSVQVSK